MSFRVNIYVTTGLRILYIPMFASVSVSSRATVRTRRHPHFSISVFPATSMSVRVSNPTLSLSWVSKAFNISRLARCLCSFWIFCIPRRLRKNRLPTQHWRNLAHGLGNYYRATFYITTYRARTRNWASKRILIRHWLRPNNLNLLNNDRQWAGKNNRRRLKGLTLTPIRVNIKVWVVFSVCISIKSAAVI